MSYTHHRPNSETKAQVLALAGFGIRQEEIASYLGISPVTLRKHYREELRNGVTRANVEVARTLFAMARSGQNVAATIFWLKARAGWSEKIRVQMIEPEQPSIDVTRLSTEELLALENMMTKARATDVAADAIGD